MRTVLWSGICLVLVGLATGSTQASPYDPFDIYRDGILFRCTAQQGDPGGSAECANKAYQGPFSRDEAIQLCAGSFTVAPADCGILAYQGPYSRAQSIELCTGAPHTGPVSCAKLAYAGPFNHEQSIRLCRRSGTEDNARCAIKAYQGPYSREEAIRLCAAQPLLAEKALDELEGIKGVAFELLLLQANSKALRLNELPLK